MRPQVVVDIDGVLAVPRPDNKHELCAVVEGALEGMHWLCRSGVRIVLWTARPEVDRLKTVEWLERNGFNMVSELLMDKPKGMLIDDNALRFTSWAEVIKKLEGA